MKLLMVGPDRTKDKSGGVVTVIESLVENMHSNVSVMRVVTMHPVGFIKRLMIYSHALFLIFKNSFKKNKIIAHIHMASNTSFYRKSLIIMILKMFKIPTVLHLHGAEFHLFYDKSNVVMKKYIKWIFSLTDRTVLLSNSWQQWYVDTINTNKSSVVYNGVRDYYDDKSLLLAKRENVVLFLGRLGERKGIYDLLTAFKEVVENIPDAILKIGGDGEIEKSKDLAKEFGIENNVEFLGWVNEEEKYTLLNQSKIYILPSYNEGLPMGLLEAMSAGLAVVSTDVGGIPEVISDKKNGLLVKAGNQKQIAESIIALLNDAKLSHDLGIEARKSFLKDFNSVSMTQQFERIYDELLK